MTGIRYRPEAVDDLDDIWNYIAAYNPAAADRYLNGLAASLERLVSFPYSGRSRDELRLGLRSLGYRRHITFYVISNDMVEIVRVQHASRDFNRIFAAPTP
ncbi:MAG: type II toxin-antitoxin system RelE/ParE family toxin [Sphingomonadaceae bacterium]